MWVSKLKFFVKNSKFISCQSLLEVCGKAKCRAEFMSEVSCEKGQEENEKRRSEIF
jgi:hypothetical protein